MKNRFKITISETIGLIFLFFVDENNPNYLYPGTILISMSGIMVLVTNMQVANLFPENRSTVLTLLNGVYDSSSCTFMVFKVLYDAERLSYSQIFIILLCGTVLMWIRTFFMMPKEKTIPWPVPQEYDFGVGDWIPAIRKSEREIQDILMQLRERAGSHESNISETFDTKNQDKSFKEQIMSSVEHLKSTSYISFNIWFIATNLRHVFFVSSVNAWLTRIPDSDCDFVSNYTNYFGIAQFFGFAFAPMAGLLIDGLEKYFERSIGFAQREPYKTACGMALVATSIIGIVFTITAMANHVMVTLILEVLFRAFTYGVHATFITLLFPSENFGFLYGVSFLIGGLTGFLAIPLFDMSMGTLSGNFDAINVFFLVLLGVSTVWTAIIHIKWI